ncbi:hypothetical protein B0H65DRAFT_4871 [Neurospora tetraspora]|uniref:Uncharacterized protein n=1 Tax=Neurospora tetraspora TaxID=94610 RepID=A0AAE0JMB5_9PEZI|nr:hypothetical protein B0H65DRAFT_4871 [Neurospora tetraspora]
MNLYECALTDCRSGLIPKSKGARLPAGTVYNTTGIERHTVLPLTALSKKFGDEGSPRAGRSRQSGPNRRRRSLTGRECLFAVRNSRGWITACRPSHPAPRQDHPVLRRGRRHL